MLFGGLFVVSNFIAIGRAGDFVRDILLVPLSYRAVFSSKTVPNQSRILRKSEINFQNLRSGYRGVPKMLTRKF
jgi:hypothetical protein